MLMAERRGGIARVMARMAWHQKCCCGALSAFLPRRGSIEAGRWHIGELYLPRLLQGAPSILPSPEKPASML